MYCSDVDSKLGRVATHGTSSAPAVRCGTSQSLVPSYAAHWFPQPGWRAAVHRLADLMDLDPAAARRWPTSGAAPSWNPAEDPEFLETLAIAPYRLNGRQAQWVIESKLEPLLHEERATSRDRLGGAGVERMNGLVALF